MNLRPLDHEALDQPLCNNLCPFPRTGTLTQGDIEQLPVGENIAPSYRLEVASRFEPSAEQPESFFYITLLNGSSQPTL